MSPLSNGNRPIGDTSSTAGDGSADGAVAPLPDGSCTGHDLQAAYAGQLRIAQSAAALLANLNSRNAEVRALKLQLSTLKAPQAGLEAAALKLFAKASPKPGWLGFRLKRLTKTLRETGLVDAAWYRRTYPDVAKAGVDPV